ncbi:MULTISPECIES: hypothetical protein [unclassified Micromonospora]|uniref:hypothetical protein n=1 Tax=unclassified Micromonospora TaxID=2617518 RepID=UPI002FF27E46
MKKAKASRSVTMIHCTTVRVSGLEDLVEPIEFAQGRFSPQPDFDLEVAVHDRHVEAVEQVRGEPGDDELAERVGDRGRHVAAPAGPAIEDRTEVEGTGRELRRFVRRNPGLTDVHQAGPGPVAPLSHAYEEDRWRVAVGLDWWAAGGFARSPLLFLDDEVDGLHPAI